MYFHDSLSWKLLPSPGDLELLLCKLSLVVILKIVFPLFIDLLHLLYHSLIIFV